MKKQLRFSLILLLVLSWGLATFDTPSAEAAGSGYTTALLGNAANVTRTTSGGIGLMGGGTDVDAAFRWMISKSGGGDFVVLRASGTDAYNPYIYTDLGGVDSVETIIVTSRTGASNSYVTNAVRNAEALFIAGGDQSNYWNYWRGTPLEDAIQSLVAKNVPIGGTSAGLHVLGEFVYTALNTSATSATVLANPYDRSVTLGSDFLHLPNLNKVITDSHFSPRDRMGRLVGFLARLVEDGWTGTAYGIGIDEQTAVLAEFNGTATLVGNGNAYFLKTPGRPSYCEPKASLDFYDIPVYRINSSGTFNLATWSGSGGTSYKISSDYGYLSSTQANGNIY